MRATRRLRLNSNTAFGEDEQRGYKQKAAFASVDFDLIPKVLTVTGGVRFYHYDEFEHGSEYYSESTSTGLVVNHPNGACTAAGAVRLSHQPRQERERPSPARQPDLPHHPGHDGVLHVLGRIPSRWLQPYLLAAGPAALAVGSGEVLRRRDPRRAAEQLDPGCSLPVGAPGSLNGLNTSQFNKPAGYDSDNLINNEIGFKSEFFEHRLMLNLSAYVMKWENVQLPLFDPVHLGNTTFDINGPTLQGQGLRGAVLRPHHRWAHAGGIERGEQRRADQRVRACRATAPTAGNPTPLGQCITVVKETTYTNPYGVLGTRPPFSPPWMFNLRARYDWNMQGAYKPFAWVGASHIGAQSNEPASFPDGNDPAQSQSDHDAAALRDPRLHHLRWGHRRRQGQLDGAALRAAICPTSTVPANISSGQFIKSEIPLRPRVLMAQFGWKF